MKIIFKDELEKEELIKILNRSPNCPSDFGLKEMCVPFAKWRRERAMLNAKELKEYLEGLEKSKINLEEVRVLIGSKNGGISEEAKTVVEMGKGLYIWS